MTEAAMLDNENEVQNIEAENEGAEDDSATEYKGLSATYSPEDNKLRLYSAYGRLSADLYAKVKAAGFSWAPKQELFVAPMWTPGREDLLIRLCGEIGDEDTSLVDRAEMRADRFDDYSSKRKNDAERARAYVQSIGKRFEFGQPILVGHHSERKARKDAQRMENGMRHAVNMWETSEYWTRRAAGALSHAKYKERPDVRARRIKKIEASQRKTAKSKKEAETALAFYSDPNLTLERATHYSGFPDYSFQMPRKEGDREDFSHGQSAYGALTNSYPTLYAPRTFEEVIARAKKVFPLWVAGYDRWLKHYENRLAYERAMLQEQGGLAADKFDIQVGGKVKVRGSWMLVLRVTKKEGRLSSVTTNCRYVSVRQAEEIQDYEAPSAEEAARVAAAMKTPPLTNYPGEGFVHITQAMWDKCPKDYKGTKLFKSTDTTGEHRVRHLLGVYAGLTGNVNITHGYHYVYISDAKRKDPPAKVPTPPASVADIQMPLSDRQQAAIEKKEQPQGEMQAVAQEDSAAPFKEMKDQLKAGGVQVQTVYAPQLFPTPKDEAEEMADLLDIKPGDDICEPSAGTGVLVGALGCRWRAYNPDRGSVTAYEINQQLCNHLTREFPLTKVICADFLSIPAVPMFDKILMNPPFANGDDIKHILHAKAMLKPGGRLVAICAEGPRQKEKLRPMVEQLGGEWRPLPAGTFKDAGTMVSTVLLWFDV